MKKHKSKKIIILLIFFVLTYMNSGLAQNSCLECNSNFATGLNSTAIGRENTASGDYSFSAGFNNIASGYSSISMGRLTQSIGSYSIALGSSCYANNLSFAFGQNAKANAEQSLAFGRYVESNASGAITIGSSYSGNSLINNTNNSLMIGFNSTQPTLFVGPTPFGKLTGNVGIGTTNPLHHLHVNGNIMLSSNQSSILFAADTKGEWGEWGIEYQNGGLNFWKPFGSNNFGNYFLFLSDKGNVGIGTELPEEKLDVKGTILTNGFKMPQLGMEDGYVLTADRSGNSKWMPSQNLWEKGLGDNIYRQIGNVGIGTDEPDERLHVNGKVVIGGQNLIRPDGYKLYVEEGIITEKVKVELVSNWADFVFEKNYKLRSIGDLETFIKENKHLPDIPSAKEVKENGIDLGEMDAKLLQKIEELTLYIIDMSKNMEAQQQQIEELKNELENKK